MRGLLAGLPRTNCWTIAGHAGDADPRGLQQLLSRPSGTLTACATTCADYVTERLRDPDAVLVVDETGDLKKGTCTVGVQRQYTGTAGRIENSQVAVFLTYAPRPGTRSSTGPCTCPGRGPTTRSGALLLASLTRPSSRPSRRWPGR